MDIAYQTVAVTTWIPFLTPSTRLSNTVFNIVTHNIRKLRTTKLIKYHDISRHFMKLSVYFFKLVALIANR